MPSAAWPLIELIAASVCLASVTGFLGRVGWLFELTSHFRLQYAWMLLGCALVFLLGRAPLQAGVSLGFALVNLGTILPLYLHGGPAPTSHPTWRAMLANVLEDNQAHERLIRTIREVSPDVILLQEVNARWLAGLQPLRSDYPFVTDASRSDGFGLLLLSRLPMKQAEIIQLGPYHVPSIVATAQLGSQTLTLVATHTFAPTSPRRASLGKQQMDALAEWVRRREGAVMVLGDLNITSWSPIFQDALKKAQLRDSRKGFGLQTSWPMVIAPLRIPIDHCLVSPHIAIHNRRIGPRIGSDHYPVIVDFSLDTRPSGPSALA